MADPTREEFTARLETVEARAETRFVELSGKMDRIVDALQTVRTELATVKADNKFTRLTIIIAVIGSAIAGIAALWVTQGNLLAAFVAGLAAHQ